MPEAGSWGFKASSRQPATSTRRLMAIVEYDGTDYAGFQVQRGERTIQGEIERALAAATQEEIRIIGAGRTDAGVHARGQVIAFKTNWRHSLEDLQRALNALLPKDIAIRELALAPENFHPRFSAVSREYRYSIWNKPVRSPLACRFAYHYPWPLDVSLMNEACSHLIGTHDFRSFGSAPKEGSSTVRTVYRARCTREDGFVFVELVANAFLRRMVRRIVGGLLRVGSGELTPDDFREIMMAKDPALIKVTVPAKGLCLIKVNYD